jgi:hypothetical protein
MVMNEILTDCMILIRSIAGRITFDDDCVNELILLTCVVSLASDRLAYMIDRLTDFNS